MKNLKLITLTSLLAIGILANCHKREIGGNQANGAILGQLVGGLGKGNCALNINLTTLYSGAIIQTAVATSTIFTQTDYEAAIGATISSQGYSSYASVPYNRKYDAFIKGGGTYDATARTADINTAKTALDATTTGQGLAALSGTSLRACTRIPNANCSLSGL
ncbi:MAG: hypothetical protein IT569_08275, partial [Leptospiraceae bacterium]|nr:hypothetical protein [Leptospiraceae bacterium]